MLDGIIPSMENAEKKPIMIEDIVEGALLVTSDEPWPDYNIRAIIDLKEKYHIPRTAEFMTAIYEAGATDEELASIYLHS